MSTLFSDNFDRANSSALGANWTEVLGDWSILSNQLRAPTAGGFLILITTTSAHAAVADCKATVTRRTASGWDGGPCVRASDQNNNYNLDAYSTGTIDVYRRTAGVETLIGTRSQSHANGDTFTLEASGTGATVTLKAYRNGVQVGADFSDTAAGRLTSATQTGVIAWALQDYDDFLVEDLAGGGGGGGTRPRTLPLMGVG